MSVFHSKQKTRFDFIRDRAGAASIFGALLVAAETAVSVEEADAVKSKLQDAVALASARTNDRSKQESVVQNILWRNFCR
ncbi:hypothetical protein A0U92_09130 [Acetobacter aceti]|uniref:Uncharacterized protein n=1 Tax=Acetobacter aceti TaxID=435 RepID=A0A1U9KGH7_ACEAC|nr:hypothetical protein A0U92_09130 [Acetobacter aceti]